MNAITVDRSLFPALPPGHRLNDAGGCTGDSVFRLRTAAAAALPADTPLQFTLTVKGSTALGLPLTLFKSDQVPRRGALRARHLRSGVRHGLLLLPDRRRRAEGGLPRSPGGLPRIFDRLPGAAMSSFRQCPGR